MLFPTFRFNRYLLHINSNGYRIEAAAAPKIANSSPVPVFGNSFLRCSTVGDGFTVA